jgi:hypothetical protein
MSEKASPALRTEDLFEMKRDATRSPSIGCDLSMDEGVKASNTRTTMQKSPRTSNAELGLINNKKMVSPIKNPIPRPSKG